MRDSVTTRTGNLRTIPPRCRWVRSPRPSTGSCWPIPFSEARWPPPIPSRSTCRADDPGGAGLPPERSPGRAERDGNLSPDRRGQLPDPGRHSQLPEPGEVAAGVGGENLPVQQRRGDAAGQCSGPGRGHRLLGGIRPAAVVRAGRRDGGDLRPHPQRHSRRGPVRRLDERPPGDAVLRRGPGPTESATYITSTPWHTTSRRF